MSERRTDDESGPADGTRVVYSTAEDRGETDLSVAVIEALAEAKGCAPVDLEQPLYEVVDPEALDRLFTDDADSEVSSRVVFEFGSHEITVHSDGDVLVRRIEA